ncbi:MAG: hypothetical protein ACFFED_04480 [Candidatus Thorarchaeota archaeon]
MKPVDRVLLGAICGFIGGIIISITLEMVLSTGSSEMLLSVIACLTATLFGESLNWAPPPMKQSKRYVYFHPDDDDEFDREIEKALGDSS